VSAWVNAALAATVGRQRRLVGLAQTVSAYEGRFRAISAEELADQGRADRESAIVVRGNRPVPAKGKTRRRAAR
jgi:hypothetical protein